MTLALEQLLVCPTCTGKLEPVASGLRCCGSGRVWQFTEGIHRMMPTPTLCFDAMTQDLERLSHDQGFWRAFYEEQTQAVQVTLAEIKARILLDVGCGPKLPYLLPLGSTIVGLDASYDSLRRNSSVDIRVWGSAVRLPLPEASVDAIVCFYSLHHMIGQTVRETTALVTRVFGEFRRVLRPGGELLVVEVAPWWPIWVAQRLLWTRVRHWVGQSFNAFFWRRSELEALAADAGLLRRETRTIRVPPFLWFPVASASWSPRMPRLLYPFSLTSYHWRMP